RAYDTQDEPGERTRLVAGTTRLIATGVPDGAVAALVNLTIADTEGAGYLRTWVPRGARPATSTVNADAPGSAVANAAIVPLDADGRFLVETSTAARVIVDVMGFFAPAPAATTEGRFIPVPSVRLADTRDPVSASNRYTEIGQGWSID